MIKYTANYTNSNHNFVIQNLEGDKVINEHTPAICIIKNILQRGIPTKPSTYLQSAIGEVHSLKEVFPLISFEKPNWERIIRGDIENNYNPAQKFFDKLIPKYFPEHPFFQQLLVPEVPLNHITQVEVNEFAAQQVDFYFPQAFLVIEIDGSQHDPEKDKFRDDYLSKYGVETVRITTRELEEESKIFKQKIKRIKERVQETIDLESGVKENRQSVISLSDYLAVYNQMPDLNSDAYLATSIIRFQVLVLELLEKGKLNFQTEWIFGVLCKEQKEFEEFACLDLFLWFENLLRLHKITFAKPNLKVIRFTSFDSLKKSDLPIKIDFSITKRYTDEFQNNSEIIYLRTDYFDHYKYFKGSSAIALEYVGLKPYDYFQLSTANLVDYKLQFKGDDDDETALCFLLENIFGYKKFNNGQLPILSNALSRNHTVGLLPTGGGKSVCYQLATLLQPAISFVVCPIKSLMYDQKQDLFASFITRIEHVTSDDDGEDKEHIMNSFSNGKFFFLFISPERFQIQNFRQSLLTVGQKYSFAYAVIDEVHCLSEWGHDFRTSYLNLAKTIARCCVDFRYIALTATASINVLKDIQIELKVNQQNVKTPPDFTRKEIEFEILDDNENKYVALINLMKELNEKESVLSSMGDDSSCGLIFTPTVNGDAGCYKLSTKLGTGLNLEIKYYSGQVPKEHGREIMDSKQFEKYKKNVQLEFKNNKSTLLIATKAFGMGVNKPNISYTIHYGIPSSMESLYQEAGRAGRDNKRYSKTKKAMCFVLFSKTKNTNVLNEIWKRDLPLSQLQSLSNNIDGDVKSNLFLFLQGMNTIKREHDSIIRFLDLFAEPNVKRRRVISSQIGLDKFQAERVIYRLLQLGVIEDWTINNFFAGEFYVDFTSYSEVSIKENLKTTITKYDKEFDFDKLNSKDEYAAYATTYFNTQQPLISRCVVLLLQWIYDHFVYNRRQSLKNIYENCEEYISDTSEGKKENFKNRIESYFKFSEASYFLQHIAENPNDYKRWFEVFYQFDEDSKTKIKTKSNRIINEKEINELGGTLSRVLECYEYNTGLDFISGLVRLFQNDFENQDGRARFESAFKKIVKLSEENEVDIDYIFDNSLKIGSVMKMKSKNDLAFFLISRFPSNENLLNKIQKVLGDQYSLDIMLSNINSRLSLINTTIDDGLRKIK